MSTRLAGRARRSTLALLTGAALATLLSVTAAGAAPLAGPADSRAGGATNAAAVDVYMQDTPTDVGLQPHSLNPLWQSPDIKVCPTAVECPTSQNPIVGQRNYIFVKLRNPGPYGDSVMEEGAIEVYRTTPGGGAAWPGAWTQIGWMAVPVYPGVTSVTIPWDNVPGPGHFCLLARWVSPNDPMTFEGPDIGVNTRNNNNIAWRNVDSVALVAGGLVQTRPFAIGNTLTRAARSSVVFSQTGAPFQTAGGRLVADLGPNLFERWAKGGKAGKGVREVGRNQVEIVDIGQASLDNLELNPGERIAFSLNFTAAVPTREKIAVNVTQIGPDTTGAARADLGGVRYDITVDQRK
ncbi:hypothetical protein OG777_30915 [Micromonospora peucetia]|uniref:Uncharacterized protein n=1 Tax=Micromonospora peucetia TaxID=47871 RepID=A0ABZ1ELK1_9ACTN|nr:hypothetical protein [Micromonospora peucetia]MCX4391317.1 hypothetical protein [Micromonospora peucetia]WSA35130.1 hypothetical protein OIE14_14330 [Micromonospora peucetia]